MLAVDMLLYCLSLLLEIASIMHLRQSQPDLERAYKIPADGFLLFLFFVPSIAICFIVFASGSLQDWVVTAIFLLAGVALIWLIEWSQENYPESYTGVKTHALKYGILPGEMYRVSACMTLRNGFMKGIRRLQILTRGEHRFRRVLLQAWMKSCTSATTTKLIQLDLGELGFRPLKKRKSVTRRGPW